MQHTRWRHRLLLVAMGLLAAASLIPAAPVTKTLPNGMEIILMEDHANPVVATFFVVKIGLRGETDASCGISHMLEHLLFNGTETRTQAQLYDDVDMLGAYNNAFTRDDFTCFMMVMPRDNFAPALAIQEDMLFHSTLPADKLEKERGIVLEELARDETAPNFAADRALTGTLFAGTPYALPVVGTPASIKDMPRDLILKYYKTYYVANNMTLLVVGDFDAAATMKLITERFSGYPRRPLPERKPAIDLFTGQPPAILSVPVRRPRLVVAVPAPRREDDDWFAFQAARMWLEDDNTSPLAALVREHKLQSFQGEYIGNVDYSIYLITLEGKPATPFTAESAAAVQKALAALKVGDLPAKLLASYRTRLEVDEIYSMENVHYLGMYKGEILADLPLAAVKRFFGTDYLDHIRAVTATEVGAVARRLLGTAHPRLIVLNPDGKGPAGPAGRMPHGMGGK